MKRIHVLIAIVIGASIGATANAQSVADLARKERERKKSLESKAVLTNSSISVPKSAEPGSVSVTNAPAAETKAETKKEEPKPAAATGPTDNKGRDEKYWRAAFDKARQDVKRAEDNLRLLDLKLNDLQAQLYREGVYTREQEIRQQITATETDQAAAHEQLDAAQKKTTDLEDELRRSGGPPGWAR